VQSVAAIEAVLRAERALATTIRVTNGDFDLAEEAVAGGVRRGDRAAARRGRAGLGPSDQRNAGSFRSLAALVRGVAHLDLHGSREPAFGAARRKREVSTIMRRVQRGCRSGTCVTLQITGACTGGYRWTDP
jgi:hypothetical protein